MEKQNNLELEVKKERLRWILTVVVIVIVVIGIMINNYIHKYKESTVTELFELAVSDYSKESYSAGEILYFSENSKENKKIILSEETLSKLFSKLEKTTVTGMKRKDLDTNIQNSYSIELQSDYVDDIVFFVGRDEKKQDLILEVLATDNDLADNYLVPDEEFFNFIEELIKQAP